MIKFNGQFYFQDYTLVIIVFVLMAYTLIIIAFNLSLDPTETSMIISLLDFSGFGVLLWLYGYASNHHISDSDYRWIQIMRKHEWCGNAENYKESSHFSPYIYHSAGLDLRTFNMFHKENRFESFVTSIGNYDHFAELQLLDEFLTNNKDEILFKLL